MRATFDLKTMRHLVPGFVLFIADQESSIFFRKASVHHVAPLPRQAVPDGLSRVGQNG
jgi:hypothetical protein